MYFSCVLNICTESGGLGFRGTVHRFPKKKFRLVGPADGGGSAGAVFVPFARHGPFLAVRDQALYEV